LNGQTAGAQEAELQRAYVINLRGDAERLRLIEDALAPWPVSITRVEALYGSSLPDDVCVRITGDSYAPQVKGAVGCFLSHVRAWEVISKTKEDWVCLLEDDALPQTWIPGLDAHFPQDADIIFATDQSLPGPELALARLELPSFAPLSRSLPRLMQKGGPLGAYCYFLKPSTAGKLLSLVAKHGYFSHVDNRLLAYGLSKTEIEAFPLENDFKRHLLHAKLVCGAEASLTAYSLSPHLCKHRCYEDTSRVREDNLGQS
jgi:hypothetical protein